MSQMPVFITACPYYHSRRTSCPKYPGPGQDLLPLPVPSARALSPKCRMCRRVPRCLCLCLHVPATMPGAGAKKRKEPVLCSQPSAATSKPHTPPFSCPVSIQRWGSLHDVRPQHMPLPRECSQQGSDLGRDGSACSTSSVGANGGDALAQPCPAEPAQPLHGVQGNSRLQNSASNPGLCAAVTLTGSCNYSSPFTVW